jgi:Ca-activated chloride channel family protein
MRKIILFSLTVLCFLGGLAQNSEVDKKKRKAQRVSNNLVADANEELKENKFIDAEATYRKAIAKSGENASARYNLGNAYYENNSYAEAFTRYKQAGEVAQSKAQKHKAYHNMGNVFMNEKEYAKAVEAYKEALRNNPADDETRYNLALAKEMLKKQQQQNKNKDKNKDNKDQKDKDKDKNKDEENKKDQKDKGENKEKKEGDKEQKEPEKNEDGKGDKKEDEKKKQQNKEGEPKEEQGQPKPRPGQLSPQQIKNILEAMSNEEKKVQEKLNTKKIKGRPKRNQKDW